jgi:NADP-dependent 3-hydroxy acid dehydrogenase YdfG
MTTASDTLPVVIVTGATGGMGREMVANLAADRHVIAVGRSAEVLDELEREHGATPWNVDITDYDALAELVAGLGRIDAVVNAAATGERYSVEEADPAEWTRQLDINVIAPSELTRQCLPKLRESKGSVVFIGSGASTKPVPGSAVYTATKHALKAVADVLRIDEAEHGIRVTTLSPGPTDTALLRGNLAQQGATYAPQRYIVPASVARAVRFVLDSSPDIHLTDLAVRPRKEL